MNALAVIVLAIGSLLAGVAVGRWLARRRYRAARTGRPTRSTPSRPQPPASDLLQRVICSAGNGLVVLDRFGEVVLHNPQAGSFGVVRGNRPDPRAWKACQQVIETGRPVEVDLRPLEQRGRQPAAVLAVVRPLGDGYTVVDAVDTSDALRLEATRRDFVANVSHELKTPVGAIGLLAEAVLDAVDDPEEITRFGTKILNEATRLGALVNELIALSRLEGAERLPELAVVEVDEVIDDAMARCRLVAESLGIKIAVDSASGLQIAGDKTLLVTALSNLLDNALAYSQAETPVSVSRRLNGDTVEIAVTDRGLGIAQEHQERVFERFFRVDPARSRGTGGTGLGLAIVKHVAQNHGGEVSLWSRPGTGSTFTLRLPATPVDRHGDNGTKLAELEGVP